MSRHTKCPYCGGGSLKVLGRVVRQSSHLAYGYGERKYKCRVCEAMWSVCYTVPPKTTSGFLPKPNPGLLKLNFKESVSGYADPVVLTAKAPFVKADEPKVEEAEGGSK
jgi:hypothetical protein